MIKRIAVLVSLVVVLSVAAVPAYAQTTTPTPNQGLFSKVTHFFGNLFHHGNGEQTQATEGTMQPGEPNPSMSPMPSGMPDMQQMQQHRLSLLVKQGKITQAQADAILAELLKVQNELKTWAASQGINPMYVFGGMEPGMSGENTMMRQRGQDGQNSGQNWGQGQGGQTQGQGQMHPMMRPNGQNQQEGQFGGQQHTQPNQY